MIGSARTLTPWSKPMMSRIPATRAVSCWSCDAVTVSAQSVPRLVCDREQDVGEEDQVVGDVDEHDEALAGARVGPEDVGGVAPSEPFDQRTEPESRSRRVRRW